MYFKVLYGPFIDIHTAIIASNIQVFQYTRSQLQSRSDSLGKKPATTTLFNPCVHNLVTEKKFPLAETWTPDLQYQTQTL